MTTPMYWSRRLFARFNALLSPITFSITLDDHKVVFRALRPQPGDRILCLASAGDTPLNLLIHDPAEVVAVDLALPQLHLARLKVAALTELSLAELYLFLGVRVRGHGAGQERLRLYQRLRKCLEPNTRRFWDEHLDMIRRGVLWQGAMQRIAPLGGSAVRIRRVLTGRSWSVADNPYLLPLLSRRMPTPELLPPYLAPRTHPVVRARADRIRWRHADVRELLRDREPGFDCFALSNVADWLNPDQVEDLLADVANAARPNARVLIWSRRRRLRTHRPLPRTLTARPAMQGRLRADDRIGYFRTVLVLRRRPSPAPLNLRTNAPTAAWRGSTA